MKKLILFLPFLLLFSCSRKTYYQESAPVHAALRDNRFGDALSEAAKNEELKKGASTMLSLLEKGRLAHLAGQFGQSNLYLNKAYEMSDKWSDLRHRTIYGTYVQYGQMSRTEWTAGLRSPPKMDYRSEDYEKVMIHYYKAMNYLNLEQKDEALVEAKQLDQLLELMKDKKVANGQEALPFRGFSYLLIGVIYESAGDLNNAFIAYEHAYLCYDRSGTPQQLKMDLLRTAAQNGFDDKLKYYEKLTGMKNKAGNAPYELVLFVEDGLVPHKAEEKVIVESLNTYRDKDRKEVEQRVRTSYKIPRFDRDSTMYHDLKIAVPQGAALVPENVFDIAQLTSVVINARFRQEADAYLKDDRTPSVNTGPVSAHQHKNTKADTRYWQTLPGSISYCRVSLIPGVNEVPVLSGGKEVARVKVTATQKVGIRNIWVHR